MLSSSVLSSTRDVFEMTLERAMRSDARCYWHTPRLCLIYLAFFHAQYNSYYVSNTRNCWHFCVMYLPEPFLYFCFTFYLIGPQKCFSYLTFCIHLVMIFNYCMDCNDTRSHINNCGSQLFKTINEWSWLCKKSFLGYIL